MIKTYCNSFIIKYPVVFLYAFWYTDTKYEKIKCIILTLGYRLFSRSFVGWGIQ